MSQPPQQHRNGSGGGGSSRPTSAATVAASSAAAATTVASIAASPVAAARPPSAAASPSDVGMNLTPVSDFLSALRIAGEHAKPYEILGPLGKGKFAMVYKARLGEELYALKKVAIFDMMSQSSRDKCLKEIQLLQSLQHPNIIRYCDSYLDLQTQELVIVLQWARGGDLKKLIKKVKSGQAKITSFSEGMIWKYAYELSSGLAYMHDLRVMHRDMKPANIMLTHDNHILLGDLGLSRYFNPMTMEAFSKVGTPLYISPEVLIGEGYTFSADTWSLGCILYELCMLISPFKPQTEGVNLYALFANIKEGKYEPIPAEDGKYSENLRTLITAMIRVDPKQRPTMRQVEQVTKRMVEMRVGKQLQPKPIEPDGTAAQSSTPSAVAPTTTASSQPRPPSSSSSARPPSASSATINPATNTAAPSSNMNSNPNSTPVITSQNAPSRPGSRETRRSSSLTTNLSPAAPQQQQHHLTVQFPNEAPLPLTPQKHELERMEAVVPLNASPTGPVGESVAAIASAQQIMATEERSVSPIEPIPSAGSRVTSASGRRRRRQEEEHRAEAEEMNGHHTQYQKQQHHQQQRGSPPTNGRPTSSSSSATSSSPPHPRLPPHSDTLSPSPSQPHITARPPSSGSSRPNSGGRKIISRPTSATNGGAGHTTIDPAHTTPSSSTAPPPSSSTRPASATRPPSASSKATRPPSAATNNTAATSSPSRPDSAAQQHSTPPLHPRPTSAKQQLAQQNGISSSPPFTSSSPPYRPVSREKSNMMASALVTPPTLRPGSATHAAMATIDLNTLPPAGTTVASPSSSSTTSPHRRRSLSRDRPLSRGITIPERTVINITSEQFPSPNPSPLDHFPGSGSGGDEGESPVDQQQQQQERSPMQMKVRNGSAPKSKSSTLKRPLSLSPTRSPMFCDDDLTPGLQGADGGSSDSADAFMTPEKTRSPVKRGGSGGSRGTSATAAGASFLYDATRIESPSSSPKFAKQLMMKQQQQLQQLSPQKQQPQQQQRPVSRTGSSSGSRAVALASSSPTSASDIPTHINGLVLPRPLSSVGSAVPSAVNSTSPTKSLQSQQQHQVQHHLSPNHPRPLSSSSVSSAVSPVATNASSDHPSQRIRPNSSTSPSSAMSMSGSPTAARVDDTFPSSPSSSSATGNDLPVDALMSTLVDTLQLLHYETRLLQSAELLAHNSTKKMPWLTRDYFCYDFQGRRGEMREEMRKRGVGKNTTENVTSPTYHHDYLISITSSTLPSFSTPTRTQQLYYFSAILSWFLTLAAGASSSATAISAGNSAKDIRDELAMWKAYEEYADEDEEESEEHRLSLATLCVHALSHSFPASYLRGLSLPSLAPTHLAKQPSGPVILSYLHAISQAVYRQKLHGSVVIEGIARRRYYQQGQQDGQEGENGKDGVEEEEQQSDQDEEIEEEVPDIDPSLDDDNDPDPYSSSASSPPHPKLSETALAKQRAESALAWRAECERVESQLLGSEWKKSRVNGGTSVETSEWRTHLETARKLTKEVRESPLLNTTTAASLLSPLGVARNGPSSSSSSSSSHLTSSSLTNRSTELHRQLSRITKYEFALQRDPLLTPVIHEFVHAREKQEGVQTEYQMMMNENREGERELESVTQSLAFVQSSLAHHRDAHSDDTGLRKMRQALINIRQEIRQFDVKIGIKSTMLSDHQRRNGSGVESKHENAQASTQE